LSPKSEDPVLLRIYSKPDCHLCDEAKSVLLRVAREFDIQIEEINIETDPEAYEQYRYDIPVIFLNDVKLFKHRVEEEQLRRALRAQN
jgi:glutaredoxin